MRMTSKIVSAFAAASLAAALSGCSTTTAQDDPEARKARILANLKLQFPQLEQPGVVMGDIKPTEFPGLDQGSITLPGRGPQSFFVSRDDKKLWMTGGEPTDVSLTQKEIDDRIAQRKADEAREATERQKKLDDAAAGVPARGNPKASVLIVEFSDFQCPYCARGAETMEQLLEKYPNDVKFVFKHFPLGFHNWAKPAAIASHCASKQDAEAFWTLHDKYFESQRSLNLENVLAKSKEFLAGTKVDLTRWATCAENTQSEEYKAASAAVDADMELGQSLGVSGTPGFFVNGTFLNGAQPVAKFEPLIQEAKAGS